MVHILSYHRVEHWTWAHPKTSTKLTWVFWDVFQNAHHNPYQKKGPHVPRKVQIANALIRDFDYPRVV